MALSVVSSVVNKLGEFAIQQARLSSELHDKVDRLQRGLQAISCFLEDADCKQKHDARVKNWVTEIREIAYDAEDIIDKFVLEFETHRFRPQLLSHYSIGSKIEDINARIEEVTNRRAKLGIKNIGDTSSGSVDHGLQVWKRSQPQ